MIERAAVPGDLGQITDIITQARLSLATLGIDQWQDGYPRPCDIAADIAMGRCRVLEEDGEIIASAAVYVGHEETYDKIYGGAWGGGGPGIRHYPPHSRGKDCPRARRGVAPGVPVP